MVDAPVVELSPTEQDSGQTFILIDGHALIYRAYHAYPELTDPQGRMVNAVYGFTRILLTVIRDQEPEYLAVAFDHKGPTMRHEAYVEYKAHREAMPDDMIPQIEIIKQVVEALNMPKFEMSGYEADDLIGTLTLQAGKKEDLMSVVVTGDKDLLQLVDDSTRVFIPARGQRSVDVLYDAERVVEKMGVGPDLVPDLKGLMGDSSDNIPGVKGIGPKTAVKLLTALGGVEQLYQVLDTQTDAELMTKYPEAGFTKSVLAKLREGKDSAFMSKELATIKRDAPIGLDLTACRVKGYNKEKINVLFEELGFKSLEVLLPEDEFEEAVASALF